MIKDALLVITFSAMAMGFWFMVIYNGVAGFGSIK